MDILPLNILWHYPSYFTENVSDLKRGISPGSQGDLTNKCSDEIKVLSDFTVISDEPMDGRKSLMFILVLLQNKKHVF